MTRTPYATLLQEGTHALYECSDTPRIDAERLLMHASGKSLAYLIAHDRDHASNAELNAFYALVSERQNGQPIAYLIGKQAFWSLELTVNENVLVPRADTETLVERALEAIPEHARVEILDLGTGSGAIALSLAKERPHCLITATDVSNAALEIAKQNGNAHGLINVNYVVSDWFDALAPQRFSLIVSNPPYVAQDDPHLMQGDLPKEPDLALIGAEDGLGDIRTLIAQAPNFLVQNGWLMIEHGYDQGAAVRNLFAQTGFSVIETRQDLNGQPRCTSGQWQTRKL